MIKIKLPKDLSSSFDKVVAAKRDAIIDQTVSALKEATPVDTGEARDGWHREGNKIVNRVEHLSELNDGSSQQAPSHFIERTILENTGLTASGIIVRPI